MGFWNRKKLASHGLLAVGIAAQHVIITDLGSSEDSDMLSAYFASYVLQFAKKYGATGSLIERYSYHCFVSLAEAAVRRGRIQSQLDSQKIMTIYLIAFDAAQKVLATPNSKPSTQRFFDECANLASWSMDRKYFETWSVAMKEVVDTLIRNQSATWKPDE